MIKWNWKDEVLVALAISVNPPYSNNPRYNVQTFLSCRDAWSLGAIDPTSGTAALLEITRAFGEMYKNGTSSKFLLADPKINIYF